LSNNKIKEIVANHPVSAGISAKETLRFYKTGILTEDFLKCSDSNSEINLSVTIVGYGQVNRGEQGSGFCQEYWIVMNSWGAQWGENGFFRLCMDGAGSDSMPYGIC
jgi:C1A family cysteine protease